MPGWNGLAFALSKGIIMPLYEYECENCKHRYEKIESIHASEENECPICQQKAHRIISGSTFKFKGSGWYVNDYGQSNSNSGSADV